MKLDVQTDHLHKGMKNRKNNGKYVLHDPKHLVHILHIWHLVKDKHKHEMLGIFDHGIPKLRRNHKLLPVTERIQISNNKNNKMAWQYQLMQELHLFRVINYT